jgi:hypothetical protein
MKKHLLATSAIVGSLFAFAGQASAQTTITPDMHLTYSAISNEGSGGNTDRAGSYRGFGKETKLQDEKYREKIANIIDATTMLGIAGYGIVSHISHLNKNNQE